MTLEELYQDAQNDRLVDLLLLHEMGVASQQEQTELAALLAADADAAGMRELFLLEKDGLDEGHELLIIAMPDKRPGRIVPMRRWAIATAACVLLAATTIILWQRNSSGTDKPLVATELQPAERDVAPGVNKAVLTLANGQQVLLDDAIAGHVAAQGNTRVIKLKPGMLAYEAGTASGTAMQFNTITTPRAGQYIVQLPDGSIAWLNAASSIRFPVLFSGKERVVETTGEVYFEVAANAQKPFKVKTAGQEVLVLGTKFNIDAHFDEDDHKISTTLLQGSVRVALNGDVTQKLIPGQQARVSNQAIELVKNANLSEVMAWKEGVFRFNETTIDVIMKQIARWYDVDVVFKNNAKTSAHFIGTIQRNVPLSQVLQLLELTGTIHFTVRGKTVVVE